MEQVFLLPYQPEQLKAFLKDAVTEAFQNAVYARESNLENGIEFITSKDVAKMLGISLPTVRAHTLAGTLKGYRIHRRVRYKRNEVEQALQAISIR